MVKNQADSSRILKRWHSPQQFFIWDGNPWHIIPLRAKRVGEFIEIRHKSHIRLGLIHLQICNDEFVLTMKFEMLPWLPDICAVFKFQRFLFSVMICQKRRSKSNWRFPRKLDSWENRYASRTFLVESTNPLKEMKIFGWITLTRIQCTDPFKWQQTCRKER